MSSSDDVKLGDLVWKVSFYGDLLSGVVIKTSKSNYGPWTKFSALWQDGIETHNCGEYGQSYTFETATNMQRDMRKIYKKI